MKKGNKVIWDSGFGFEIGYFIEKNKTICDILLASGRYSGMVLVFPDFELSDYSDELCKQLTTKYGFEKIQYFNEKSKTYKSVFNGKHVSVMNQ